MILRCRLLLVLLVGATMMGLAWVGYVGSDDHSYVRGALGWLNDFPYVGRDHWTLRHTVVLPIAASLALVGSREIALALPSAALFLVLLGTTHRYSGRFFGDDAAPLASLLLATTPLFAVQATFPQNVIPMTLAVSVSFWLFCAATRHPRPTLPMFFSGVAAGLAWITLEITAALLLFYALLFVTRRDVPRRAFWSLAVGFAAIVGVEVAYFAATTGDPLYRYRIDLSHDLVDRIGDAARAMRAGYTLNAEGNLSVHPLLDPVVGLLANQEFGLIFWLAVPAALWVWRSRSVPPDQRHLLRLLTGLGLVWMAFVSLNLTVLYVVPRYYAVSTWAAVILVACWLRALHVSGRPRLAALAAAGVIAGNLAGVYVENKNPLFAERHLVEIAAHTREPIYTDPMTLTRARLLLEFGGSSNRVRSEPVPPGALFYANPKNIERCRRSTPKCRWRWEDYLPRNGWIEVERVEPERRFAGLVLAVTGIDRLLPREIFERIDRPNPGAVLYRAS
jgi:4-amino-4-deoxy-L-arabinose transferase-like glycosyltransferase